MELRKIIKAGGYALVLFAVVAFAFATGAAGQMKYDEYQFLTGVIKRIDPATNTVVVDVTNKGCHGTKTFRVDDFLSMTAAEGDRIEFFVDSAGCPKGSGSTMFTKGLRRIK